MKIEKRNGTIGLCVFLIILCSFLFYQTFSLPEEMGPVGSRYGSAFFPRILSGCIILSSTGLLIQSFLSKKKGFNGEVITLSTSQILRVVSLWSCCLLFYAAWNYVGFLWGSCLFMPGIGFLLGVRKIWLLLLLAALGPVLFFIFERFLRISLS